MGIKVVMFFSFVFLFCRSTFCFSSWAAWQLSIYKVPAVSGNILLSVPGKKYVYFSQTTMPT